jgi:hypothetical protein
VVRPVTESAPIEWAASSNGANSALSIIRGSWSELGEILEPHLAKWPKGDRIGDVLREGLAIPSRRRPEDYAAILLMRLNEKLDLPGLSSFFSKPIDPNGNAGQLHKLVDALDSIASMPLRPRAEALQAQIEALATAKLDAPSVSTEAVAMVRGVKTKSDLPRVEFGALASSLAYGGSKAIALIEEEMRRDPDGRFAFAVRSSGYRADAFPGEKLGDLILLLSRYRSRTDPRALDGQMLADSFGDVAPKLLAILDELSRAPLPKEPNLMALGQMIRQLGRRLPKQKAKELADELVRRPDLIPKSNPVLDRVLPHIPDGTLAGQGLVAVQHLLPSVCNLIEACIKKGMRPEQIHVLATPYNCTGLQLMFALQ